MKICKLYYFNIINLISILNNIKMLIDRTLNYKDKSTIYVYIYIIYKKHVYFLFIYKDAHTLYIHTLYK